MDFFKHHRWLSASIISRTPFVIAAFIEDVATKIELYKIWFENEGKKHKSVKAILMLGFHYETPSRMAEAQVLLDKIRKELPRLDFCIFGNSPIEAENFRNAGAESIYCNQNAFLDERRYPIIPRKKVYDAVYLARLTPFKRHHLAYEIQKLLLIGCYNKREEEYAKNILSNMPTGTVWKERVRGILLFWELSRAKTALCLSAEEGAMYAASECALCGLPIVTTENRGGRLNSLAEKYSLVVGGENPTAADIAEGVREQISKNFNPKDVHRAIYAQYMRKYFDKSGEGTERDFKFAMNFPHKLGVRCRVTPLFRYTRMLFVD